MADSRSFIAGESVQDVIGHGTHVAGLLAAENNNIGVVGVAAGATVVAIKVVNKYGYRTMTSECNGLDYVVTKASTNDIINMSLQTYPDSVHSINQCVRNTANMGFRIVAAAGNHKYSAFRSSPGSVDNPNVWTVSAFKQGDIFAASFSDYGNPPIDYSEPGVDLTSTGIGGGTVSGLDGTSFATPILAGLLLADSYGVITDGVVSNDPDGNPDPIAMGAFPPPPLSVFIDGPQEIQPHTYAWWTAETTNGTSPFQYY